VTIAGSSILIDLDGVIWRGDDPIAGSAQGVAALRQAGCRLAFFTNNSYPDIATQLAKLGRVGVEADRDELLSSSQAAALLVEPGEPVLTIGGPGVLEALEERGAQLVEMDSVAGERPAIPKGGDMASILAELADFHLPEVRSVVAGFDPRLDYRRLAVAMQAVRGGARLIGTNSDATYPLGRTLVPGAGSWLAAVSVASGVTPVVAGKPNAPAADLARRRLGEVAMVIGDRPDTDGGFASRLGARFALVLSGVTPPGHGPVDPVPDLEAADLGELAAQLVGG